MTRGNNGAPAPSAELVAAVATFCLEHGLSDLSLRPLARAIGTSDRMLVYHFKSKDGLVAAAVAENGKRLAEELAAAEAGRSLSHYVERAWQALSSPRGRELVAFFLELHVLALRRGEPYRAAAARLGETWHAATTARLRALGMRPAPARRNAELLLAAIDGLMLHHAVDGALTASVPPPLRALVSWIEGELRNG